MATIQVYQDSITTQLNTEVTVISLTGDITPYAIVSGYLDLSGMPSDAVLVIREYIGLSQNPVLFLEVSVDETLNGRIIRFHGKELPNGGIYKVTVEQIQGSSFSIPYWFAKTGLT